MKVTYLGPDGGELAAGADKGFAFPPLTVEALFAKALGERRAPWMVDAGIRLPDDAEIAYNEELGYPRLLKLDWEANAIDNEVTYHVAFLKVGGTPGPAGLEADDPERAVLRLLSL